MNIITIAMTTCPWIRDFSYLFRKSDSKAQASGILKEFGRDFKDNLKGF